MFCEGTLYLIKKDLQLKKKTVIHKSQHNFVDLIMLILLANEFDWWFHFANITREIKKNKKKDFPSNSMTSSNLHKWKGKSRSFVWHQCLFNRSPENSNTQKYLGNRTTFTSFYPPGWKSNRGINCDSDSIYVYVYVGVCMLGCVCIFQFG